MRKSVSLVSDDYMPKIERCLAEVGAADVWWRPNDASNSMGNLVLHLCGNVTQWIIGGVGQQAYARARQLEFDERGPIPVAQLRAKLQQVVTEAVAVIQAQDRVALVQRRRIQGYDVTVLDAIYHVVEHFSMHTGQIIALTKLRAGIDLALWTPPDRAANLKSEI